LAGTFGVPLELNIPKHMPPVDIDVYVVVHGDTLWSISERLTGSPFNYPRIAGRNKIANPNLIFPGQKIQLIK
jgi:nucleoid-associated protein YgaU